MHVYRHFADHAHRVLARGDGSPIDFLPADIYESWARCVAMGLDPSHTPSDLVDTSRLPETRDAHALVRRFATAEMAALQSRIFGSGFVLALSTPDGMVLDVAPDEIGIAPAARAVQPGSLWSESRCGTNALGVAAILRRTVVVHGFEHFVRRFGGLVCIAAPIFAPDGSLAGILDASADFRSRQRHTKALLEMAVTQIENSLLYHDHRDNVVIAFHVHEEYLKGLDAGLIALDRGGTILAMNRAARWLLRASAPQRGKSFSDVFRSAFGDVLRKGRTRQNQVVQTNTELMLHAAVETFVANHGQKCATEQPKSGVPSFVAKDPSVAAILRKVEAAAARKIPILIRGETGTGKEQLARHAHAASGRPGAFVPINCAGLPASLIEAELFGYVEGAFTGARRGGSTGLVREADGGTLFLDEIGDMPIALQAVLLRFLDDWTARPIGGTGRKVDVFLISATNAGLDRAIAEGRFRADLLYRLNTLEVTLPPLSARGDFAEIARHLLAGIDPGREITDATIARLGTRAWPGNIRQLRNEMARLSLGAEGLIDEADAGAPPPRSDLAPEPLPAGEETLRDAQTARILTAYAEAGGNISETARRLAISRNTVYRALETRRGRVESAASF